MSVRAARERRLVFGAFQFGDIAAIVLITAFAVHGSSSVSLLHTGVDRVLPWAAGAVTLVHVLRSSGAYRLDAAVFVVRQVVRQLVLVAVAAGVAALAALVTAWSVSHAGGDATRTALIVTWVAEIGAALLLLHTIWWLSARALRATGWATPNLVIVGATTYAETLIRDALDRKHVNVLGVFDDRHERRPDQLCGVPVLGGTDALLSHKIMPFVDRVVIAVQPEPTQRVLDIAAHLDALPNDITFFTAEPGSSARWAAVERLGDPPPDGWGSADTVRRTELERRAAHKRLQDLLLALPLLILAAPFLVLIAALVKFDSAGPVFFRQHRHGFNNEDFRVWKFRSMHPATHDDRNERQVTADDERITRVGRLLRRTSLDELPQLINVVRGEMSMVGPRPHAIGMKTGEIESAQLVAAYAHRHRIKPGITGWAAVNGSRGPLHTPAEVQARIAYDLEYISRRTLALDVTILLRTLPTMLGDRTATR